LKFPEIPTNNIHVVIPGSSCQELLGWQIPSGPDS